MSAAGWSALFLALAFAICGWVSWWMVDAGYRGACERVGDLRTDKRELRAELDRIRQENADLQLLVTTYLAGEEIAA